MPKYLFPGVYVEEIDTGNKPIEGVATSTAGFLGITERGPVDPMFISNFGEYQRNYGDYLKDRYLTYGIEGFFQNGGERCFVARVVPNDPATKTASGKFDGMEVTAIAWRVNQEKPGFPRSIDPPHRCPRGAHSSTGTGSSTVSRTILKKTQ